MIDIESFYGSSVGVQHGAVAIVRVPDRAEWVLGDGKDVPNRGGQAEELPVPDPILPIHLIRRNGVFQGLQVAFGFGNFGAGLSIEEIRQGDGDENHDNGDDDEQFNQSEAVHRLGVLEDKTAPFPESARNATTGCLVCFKEFSCFC